MQANESTTDRLIRLILGVVFFILGFFLISGIVGIILGIVGIVVLITGITGFCGLYKILGIATNKSKEA